MSARPRTLAFVGGGTGGHLQPGVVLRAALLRRHPDWRALFVIAGREVEKRFVTPDATCLELFPGAPSRPSPWRADLYFKAWVTAARVLGELQPDLLVFLGGYTALIARLAQWRAPMVILESNAWPGRSARVAARFARRIFLQWPAPAECGLPEERVRVTGMPLKFDILPDRQEARGKLGLPTVADGRVLLVLGGSLGATALNDRMIAGARELAATPGVAVVHVTGPRDEKRVREAYAAAGVTAVVMKFCDEMATCYAAADLVVARAGGMTVAEVAGAGRAALFLPYPHHRDGHQEWNARMLVERDAAWVVREAATGDDFVAREVLPRLQSLEELDRRGRRAGELGRRDATRRVVEEIERLLDLELLSGAVEPVAALSPP